MMSRLTCSLAFALVQFGSIAAYCAPPLNDGPIITPRPRASSSPAITAVDDLLGRWHTASRTRPVVVPEQLMERYRHGHSGHEIARAAELLGPVQSDQLRDTYHWTASNSESMGQQVDVLTGTPRDDVDRLFFSSVDVTLNQEGQAVSIRFRDEQGNIRPEGIRLPVPRQQLAGATRIPSELKVPERPYGGIDRVAFVEGTSASSPNANPTRATDDDVENLSDDERELLGILDHWTNAGRNIQTADIQFRITEYDSAYRIETRSQGRMRFESPDRGLLTLLPQQLPEGTKSSRTDPAGVAYQLGTVSASALYWTEKELHRIDPAAKTCESFARPSGNEEPGVQQVGSWDVVWTRLTSPRSYLPGFIELDTDTLLGRFYWTVLVDDTQRIILIAKTRQPEERRHFSELHILIDPKTFQTQAVKIIDSTGSRETVYVIEKMSINEPRRLDGTSWEPDLKQFRKLTGPPLAPPSAAP